MKKLQLKKIIDSKLFLRQTAVKLFQTINRSSDATIQLDFTAIGFMSRSFADEYLKQKEKTTKKIQELNVSTEIKKMFHYVKHATEKPVIIAPHQRVKVVELA